MDIEEALKAFNLAQKYDREGNTTSAIKWATKSISISKTSQAETLLTRLQASGSRPTASTSSTAASSTQPKSRSSTTKSTSEAAAPKRTFTPEQADHVKRIRSAGGDFYKVLNIEKSSDDSGIKKAYRKVRSLFLFVFLEDSSVEISDVGSFLFPSWR